MFKHRPRHCHFPKPRKRVTKKIIKVTVIKFEPKRHHRFHEDFVTRCHHHRKHRHHRHHECHRRHHKFF